MPIVEPEILLDGEHGIERTFEVAQKVWAETFYYMAENNVMFEGILLKPSMVTPGAECEDRATPEQVADYTLKLLHRRIPPAVPGIMVCNIFPSCCTYCPRNGDHVLTEIVFLLCKKKKCSSCLVGSLRSRRPRT